MIKGNYQISFTVDMLRYLRTLSDTPGIQSQQVKRCVFLYTTNASYNFSYCVTVCSIYHKNLPTVVNMTLIKT
jgi:hypothetical protein